MAARVIRRARGTGISIALGASRRGIFCSFRCESLLLGASAGLLGLGAAYGLTGLLRGILAQGRGHLSEEAARLLFGGAGQAVGRTILSLGRRRPEAPPDRRAFRVVGVYADPPALAREAFGIADFPVPYTVAGLREG